MLTQLKLTDSLVVMKYQLKKSAFLGRAAFAVLKLHLWL